MEIGRLGINLIKEFEGIKLKSYRCPAGVLTIGYGHTGDVYEDQIIDLDEAEEILKQDLEKFEDAVSDAVIETLNQNQFDALVSFTYNLGAGALRKSTLLKLLNQNKHAEAAEQFLRWNKAGGMVLAGLTRRRLAEKELFELKMV